MIRLSAFADEISPNLDEQIAVLRSENIRFLDLRSVWNTNVIDLTDTRLRQVKQALDAQGMAVAAIGSPIGKVPLDSSFEQHLQRFERAITAAHITGTPYIRIFSFYPPSQQPTTAIEQYRDSVLEHLRALTTRAREAGITLLHENEKGIFGDTIARCVDVLQSVDDPAFQAAFDPANFLQCDQVPYPAAYEALKPWLAYVHVKDVRADGVLSVAGDGEARWPALLQQLFRDGYDGFLSLEPHLAASGKFQGFSGPALFQQASQALQKLLQAMNWSYR